jgi:hypothetical protein
MFGRAVWWHAELALAQALRFEPTLRQKDVIGEWFPSRNGRRWANGLVWNHIDSDMVLCRRTTRTGAEVEFDPTAYPLVIAELEASHEARWCRDSASVPASSGIVIRSLAPFGSNPVHNP